MLLAGLGPLSSSSESEDSDSSEESCSESEEESPPEESSSYELAEELLYREQPCFRMESSDEFGQSSISP